MEGRVAKRGCGARPIVSIGRRAIVVRRVAVRAARLIPGAPSGGIATLGVRGVAVLLHGVAVAAAVRAVAE